MNSTSSRVSTVDSSRFLRLGSKVRSSAGQTLRFGAAMFKSRELSIDPRGTRIDYDEAMPSILRLLYFENLIEEFFKARSNLKSNHRVSRPKIPFSPGAVLCSFLKAKHGDHVPQQHQ